MSFYSKEAQFTLKESIYHIDVISMLKPLALEGQLSRILTWQNYPAGVSHFPQRWLSIRRSMLESKVFSVWPDSELSDPAFCYCQKIYIYNHAVTNRLPTGIITSGSLKRIWPRYADIPKTLFLGLLFYEIMVRHYR